MNITFGGHDLDDHTDDESMTATTTVKKHRDWCHWYDNTSLYERPQWDL